ncbi:MspA family porin [Nocardia inohanensis]|uniref:MspA family porin n=1 Tax=Nocardia inohanensis TaxID=209246 RepID=UPI00082FD72E|nr:MspA family porin [Nocardia inohanensis]
MCGVAFGATLVAGTAAAEFSRSADHSMERITADGWTVRASSVNVGVNSVPNLAQSPWTREAFVDAGSIGAIEGAGSSEVKSAVLRTGIQLGCNTDVSQGIEAGSSTTIGPDAKVTLLPTPGTEFKLGPSIEPSLTATIKPGTITSVTINERTLDGKLGAVDLAGMHVHVDGCLGPVSVRVFTEFAVSTGVSDTVATVYSDPKLI